MVKKRVVIFHENLNFAGGAERVCLEFLEVASKLGYSVELMTLVPTEWDKLDAIFETSIRPDKERFLFSSRKPFDHYYGRLLTVPFMGMVKDETTITINTMGYSWLPVRSDIVYEHTPPYLWPRSSGMGKSLLWEFYYAPYSSLGRRLLESSQNDCVLANSQYTASMIEWIAGVRAQCLYPPVNVAKYACSNHLRGDTVVTCGRYDSGKNYECVLELAKKLPHLNFIIIGSAMSREAVSYYLELKAQVAKKHLGNINLLVNVPLNTQKEIYCKSRVYLHTTIGEDFGIAVVEAMASGLVPVVHRSGGLWTEVVESGRFGFGYGNLPELTEVVNRALKSEASLRTEILAKAMRFSKEEFQTRSAGVLSNLDRKKHTV